MNILTIGLNILPRQGEKPQPVQIIESYYNTYIRKTIGEKTNNSDR